MEKFTESYNPFSNELLGLSKENTVEEVERIVSLARTAQREWADLTLDERIKYFYRLRNLIVENADKISELISKENGKIKIDALAAEVLPITMAINYFIKNCKRFLKDKKIKSGNIFLINKRSFIHRVPFGVVGIIAPWNYPFSIPMFDIITALLSGNAVIFKAASDTQMVGRKIEELIFQAGFPKNIFSFINLPGKVAGEALLASGINKLFFTGSTEVGKELASKAAMKLIPVSLELGGNDPMIVLDDADIERAVNGAIWGGFHNCGQSCGGVERIYVHEKIYDAFIKRLKTKVENLVVGNPCDYSSDLGVMTNLKQKQIVEQHISDALNKGAKILASSRLESNSTNAINAVVLIDVNHSMLVMKDETFGPVVGIMKYSEIDEAIRLANDTNFGLTASVWSRNNKKAIQVGKKINAGVVNINDHLMSHGMAETPWGGFKDSGGHRSHGEFGFMEMTQAQVIIKDILPFVKRNLWWHPYSKKIYDGLIGLIDLQFNRSLLKKFKGAIQLLKIIKRIFR